MWIQYSKYLRKAVADGIPTTEVTTMLSSALTKEMIGDFKVAANHGCGPAQILMAFFYWSGLGPIRADKSESLKWIMLAEKSGYMPARYALVNMIPKYSNNDVAKAREWVEAWRPSD